jgi:nitroreductase
MTPALTLTATEFRGVVAAAVRAPSLHNSQPWRFRLRDGTIEVYADPARRLPAADPTDWALRIACGAAILNARLALAVLGLIAGVRLRPVAADPDLMARLTLTAQRPATPTEKALCAAIARRHTNRTPFWPTPVPADARLRLVEAARAEGAWLELLIGAGPVGAVAEITHAANRLLARDEGYTAELTKWTRTGEGSRDGVPASAGGPSPEPQDLLPSRAFGDRTRAPGRDFEPEPIVAVLGTAGDDPSAQLGAGVALQRVLLTATDAGLATSMLSQPIELAAAREQLRLALGRSGSPQMVLRVGYGEPGFPTPRREPEDVIAAEDDPP